MVRIVDAFCLAAACAIAHGLRSDADMGGMLQVKGIAIPAGVFNVGQRVQVRDSGDEEWKTGTVSSVDPFKVTPEGWDEAFRWKFVRPSASQALVQKPTTVASAAAAEGALHDPVDALMPQLPEEPGCYVWMPTGCPKNSAFRASSQWHRDEHGEEHGALSHEGCSARARSFNSWCGATDARMRLVPPKAPRPPAEPGCYVRHPTGCPKQNLRVQNSWKRDVHGEENLHATESRTVCEADRKRMFDAWCGTEDTDMVFVDKNGRSDRAPVLEPLLDLPEVPPLSEQGSVSPTAASLEEQVVHEYGMPELPAEPGCFVWMPSGCPKSRAFKATTTWKRDEYGEQEKGARVSKKVCRARASSFNTWCGATDARTMFIAAPPPAAPTEPGCYVFHRSGCPRQSVHLRNEWQRDSHGEDTLNAAHDKEACESQRKHAFDAWCGVDDTAMMFVPKIVGLQDGHSGAKQVDSTPVVGTAVAGKSDAAGETVAGAAMADPAQGHAEETAQAKQREGVPAATENVQVQPTEGAPMAQEPASVDNSSARKVVVSQVTGDSITNLDGQEFKFGHPGTYTLLKLPRGNQSSLVLEGRVEAVSPCTLFLREITVAGSALGEDTFKVRTRSQPSAASVLEVKTLQDAPWMPLANFSAADPHMSSFWAWLLAKFWSHLHPSDPVQAASGVVALKTYKSGGTLVEMLAKKVQAGSDSAEGDIVDIHAGDVVVRVSLGESQKNPWLNVALDLSSATTPAGSSGDLAGILAHDEPQPAWLQPTEECARRLKRHL